MNSKNATENATKNVVNNDTDVNTDIIQIISPFLLQKGGLLPALHAIQHVKGFISDKTMRMVAKSFNLSRAEVFGVVQFYHDFREQPVAGKYVLKLCQAEACQSRGSSNLATYAKSHLGVGWDETTKDGNFTLEKVFCLGLCAIAPSIMLDGQIYGRMEPARLEKLLQQKKKRG